MKIFKRVYFSVMAVLTVLMLTFSFVDSSVGTYKNRFDEDFSTGVEQHVEKLASGSRNIYNNSHLTASRDYIVQYIGGFVTEVDSTLDTEDGKNTASVSVRQGGLEPTLTVQSAIISQDTQKQIEFLGGNTVHAAKEVNNILVYIPGTDTKENKSADVVMMMAHYDSVVNGAMDNASSVASMMENIRYITENKLSYKNDLLYVFTDAEEEGYFGAHAAYYQFKGFNDVMSRVKMGANFDSMGNQGTLIMFQTSDNNSAIASTYRKINGGTFTSSIAAFVYSVMNTGTDFEVYGDIPSLNFANLGGTGVYHSSADNVDNFNLKIAMQISDMIFKVGDYYGAYDLNALKSDSNAVFFSYLNIATVYYPAFVSFILCGLIIGLIAAICVLNAKKQMFSWVKTFAGAGVQLLSVFAVMALSFAAYFIITLLMSGFDVVPVQFIASLKGSNIGILLGAMTLTGALLSGLYIVLRKAFNVKAGDIVRGNALIWVALALILGFALPAIGYVFIVVAIFELAAMLIGLLLRDKYNAKVKASEGDKSLKGIGGLFLYAWGMIFALPLIIPVISLGSTALGAVMLPVIMILFSLMAGSVLPYITYLKPVMQKLVSKLPERTVKVRREVTEQVEDKAKKGKFTTVTSMKVYKEKIGRTYSDFAGIGIVSVICAIVLIFCSSFGLNYNINAASTKKFSSLIYDGSIVYVYEQNDGTVSTSLEVRDPMAYKYISSYISGYKWDADKNAYVKPYNDRLLNVENMSDFVMKDSNSYSVRVYDQTKSRVTIKFSGARGITSFKFTNGADVYEYENVSSDTFTFKFPYGWGNFEIQTVGSASELEVEYTEEIMGNRTSDEIKDVIDLRAAYANNKKVEPYIDSSIIIKIMKHLH